jgi:hypothetical protein
LDVYIVQFSDTDFKHIIPLFEEKIIYIYYARCIFTVLTHRCFKGIGTRQWASAYVLKKGFPSVIDKAHKVLETIL